jgi:aminopeptidase
VGDPRVDQLARTLVRYSVELRSGERLLIRCRELAKPLALAVYAEALEVGALPSLWVDFEETEWLLHSKGSDEQVGWTDPLLLAGAEQADAYVSIRAPANLKALSSIPPGRHVLAERARGPWRDIVLRKRWVVVEMPTPAFAQEAGMSLPEFEEFSFGAVSVDWPGMRADLARRKEQLEAASEVRIVGTGTDLRLGVEGRIWVPDDGKNNMPGGEIFTGPIENSVEGEVTFDYPAVHSGREVEGAHLRFVGGRVVEASARRGEELLLAMLDADDGARRLGELGIGTNYGIDRYVKSTLFDEKIGGTVHLALGRSCEDTGGKNVSSIHWDLVKDLRAGGEIRLDGRVVQRNGRFVD